MAKKAQSKAKKGQGEKEIKETAVEEKTPEATNGNVVSKESSSKNTNTSSAGGRLNLLHLLVAVVSLLVGIVAPHLWEISSLSSQPKAARRLQTMTPRSPCDEQTLAQYLHDIPVPGLHVVCIQPDSLVFFKNAQLGHSEKVTVFANIHNWGTLKKSLSTHLALLGEDALRQPWATFSPDGHRLLTETDADEMSVEHFGTLGMFLVMQGGQWIWPGVRKGFERTIALGFNQTATLETLSLHPLVLSVKGFLSEDECDFIQRQAEPSMEYSEVTLMDHDKGRPASDFRTSQTTFLRSDTPVLEAIDDRTAALVRIPASHQESVQVLRYGNTEKYDTHHDYFDPKLYKTDTRTLSLIQHGKRNRMATVFWYLSDVAQGGETVFPRVDKGPQPPSGKTFDRGLRVKPERGKVIIFYSMTTDGKLDPYSLHGAAPVKEGTKWAANKWVWNMPTQFG
jgi:prolyl 4-hydroxylase